MRADQPSSTALLIARSILLSAQDPRRSRLVAPGEAEASARLLADNPSGWFDIALRHEWMRRWLFATEHGLLPGIITHYLARKRWIEIMVRQSLARDVTQVVVLGAGFDTLAWRLRGFHPRIQFFELDHPATQAPKQRNLGPTPNLSCLPINLGGDSPAAALRSCPAFSADKPTVFIAEGLLMYFGESRVAALLQELAALTRPPAEMIFTFMERMPDGSIVFQGGHAAIGWWLRWRREPFQWGIARAALAGFLRPLGWQASPVVDHTDLRALVLAPLGLAHLSLARGECLCHASVIQS